jgi:hypothetical protein
LPAAIPRSRAHIFDMPRALIPASSDQPGGIGVPLPGVERKGLRTIVTKSAVQSGYSI